MTAGVIATIKIQTDSTQEFETVLADLAEQLLANGPGCTCYVLHCSRNDPHIYKVLVLEGV